MSWLLGLLYQQQSQDFSQYAQPPEAGSGGDAGDSGDGSSKNVDKSQMEAYRFDWSALERAAAAVKDLEKSPHAAEVLALAKLQEATKAKEYEASIEQHRASIEQHRASIEQLRVKQERIKGEERRKAIAEETKQHQIRAQFQDSLARKRFDDQLAQQQRMNEENLRRQEESVARQEAMRRAMIQYEEELKLKYDMIKLEAELKVRAKIDRENQLLTLRKIRLEAAAKEELALEYRKTTGALLGAGTTASLQEPNEISAISAGLCLLALGFYTVEKSTGVTGRYINDLFSKPSLVRETSKFGAPDVISYPTKAVKKLEEKSPLPRKTPNI